MAIAEEVSQLPVPADVFERFGGRWVAIRGERVVADATTLAELDANPDVEPSDTRFLVPESESYFF